MEILIAVAFYLGFAMLVGRFLSLSHRGEVLYPVPPGATHSPPETAEAVTMPSGANSTRENEKEKEAVQERSREPVQS